ncbi:unnamed protein product, partial [Closterium sp. NIES-64]
VAPPFADASRRPFVAPSRLPPSAARRRPPPVARRRPFTCGPVAALTAAPSLPLQRPRRCPCSGPVAALPLRPVAALPLRPVAALTAAPSPPLQRPRRRPPLTARRRPFSGPAAFFSGPVATPATASTPPLQRPSRRLLCGPVAAHFSGPAALRGPAFRSGTAAQQPSRRAAEPPSSRAAEQPSRRASEPPEPSLVAEPSSRPVAEPPSRPSRPVRTDGLSLFDLTSGASPALAADADATVRSQWATRDAAARLAPTSLGLSRSVRRLPLAQDAALARARGAGALEELAEAVEEAVEAVEGVGVAVGVVAGVEVSVAAVEAEAAAAVAVGAEVAEMAAVEKAVAVEVELVGVELRRGSAPVVVSASSSSSSSALVTSPPLSSSVSGTLHASGVGVLFDAILAAMYAVTISDEGDCYRCFPPDPGIETAALGTGEAAALGASEAAALGARASAPSGAGESALSGTASASASHTFTLDSGASRSFFRDRTTLTPLGPPVALSLADPSGGPVLAHYSTVRPCPAAPFGTLSGLYLPSFSTNLVAASVQVFAVASRSGPESAPCSCRLLSHETLLWHHRLGHPSLLRLRGMASRLLVSGLPRSLPPLPPGPGPTCVPCVEGHQRVAPHSSQFPPTEAPLQTLHMDVWGPARVRGQGHERYFLLVVDDYSRYTTVFPLRSKGDVTETFTLPDSPQQNGIAERRIGMVMDVARTSMMHAAAPHFLWAFAVRYAAHHINLHPRVSMLETSPALLWTGKVGDASAFWVWGSRAFVGDLSADKLSPHVAPCVFLGFPPNTPGWQFYHPTSRRVLSSQDVTFDESVPYYRLFPYRTPSHPPPPLFLVPGPPPVDPLPPQGPALSGVSQVDAVEPVEITGDSGAAEGAEPGGADSGGAERVGATPGGAEPAGATTGGAEPGGAATRGAEPGGAELGGTTPGGPEPGGATPGGAEPGGAEPEGVGPTRVASGGAGPGGSLGASSRREPLSPQELREWFARRWRRAIGAGGSSAAEGAGAAGPGGARTGSTGAAGPAGTTRAGAAEGVGAEATAVGPGRGLAGGTTGAAGGTRAGGAPSAGAAAGGAGAVPAMSGVAARPRPYFVPLLQQPSSPLPAPSPYTGPTGGLAERREPASRPASPVRAACTSGRGSRQRPPPVPGTHQMTLHPSTAPLRAPLPSPPKSSLPALPDPESDSLRAASPTVTRLLATVVTDPSFESTAASALVAELVDFAARCRLDYAASLVAESVCPPSVGGECALGTDVLEDRQEEFQCLAAASPHLVSVLLTPDGDPDALDIPTPRSYAEAIEGPYSSQWQAAMDAEMASWKSTSTYVDEVPPPGANIVSGMWIFRVKRPPGSPPVFKARYVARGFSQWQGVDYFQTFSPTPKMTTLRVLLHVAAQCDYELHSLDFSTAFLQGSLHEEIWLRHPPGFTGSFPPGIQWSLRRPVYGLRQAPREWHNTLRTTLAALGFAPSTADPSLFLRTDTSLPPFYILVYVDDLVFATTDTAGLAHVKSELRKRHTCTDLGELRSYLGLQITRDRAQRTITLTQSHMVQQVLQRFGFTYSSPQATPLPTRHSLSALPSDESVESSGPYPELVGCLMYLMICTRPDLAYPLSILARYVAPGRHRPEHMAATKRVLRYLCSTSGMGLVLGGRSPVVLTGHADASWADDQAKQRSS